MALQGSGTISFLDIQNQFGGSNPITMDEYATYRTAGSGSLISLSDFYGAQASVSFRGVTYGQTPNRYMSITAPDGLVGDMLMLVTNGQGASPRGFILAIAGWTQLINDSFQAVFYKITTAGIGETVNVSFDRGNGGYSSALFRFRGTNSQFSIDSGAAAGVNTASRTTHTLTLPPVTAVAGSCILAIFHGSNPSATFTTPAGYTLAYNDSDGTVPSSAYFIAFPAAGSINATSTITQPLGGISGGRLVAIYPS